MRRRESPTDSDLGPKAVNGREMRVSSSRAMMKWWLMPLFVCVCVAWNRDYSRLLLCSDAEVEQNRLFHGSF